MKESPRPSFYFSDDGDVMRSASGLEDDVDGAARHTVKCWMEPFVKLRIPHIFNLRRDPFERADENSNTYLDWWMSHAFLIYEMQGIVAGRSRALRSSRRARSLPRSTSTR